jgi:ectoine hydroxylase-related dioxygenase (phytanoyl-CoA dioxygenase family)
MRVVKRTHRSVLSHKEEQNDHNLLSSGLTLDEAVDQTQIFDVELQAGEMSLHHVNLVHGSNPNKSTQPRIGFAVRYISASFTQELPHHEVVVAAGEYHENNFDVLTTPPTGTMAENVKKQRIAHDKYMSGRSFGNAKAGTGT